MEVTPREARTYVYHDMLLRTSSGRIILPVYRIIGRRSRPEEPPAALTGKLVNNEFQNMPAHYFDPVFICSDSYYSDDDGRSWQHCQDGELVILLDSNATFSHVGEPTVTEVAPGKLLMLLRTSLNRLFEAWSYDNGETWTRPQPTSLASSTAPGQIRSLPNGHLLAVWNQQSEREILQGYGRTRMSAAISRNGGSIWEFFPEPGLNLGGDEGRARADTTRWPGGVLLPARSARAGAGRGQRHHGNRVRILDVPVGTCAEGQGDHQVLGG